MKKTMLYACSFLIALSLLLMPIQSVIAAPSADGPVVSTPSGGGSVTTTLLPVGKLPGTVTNEAGTIFPQGHESGDMTFGGDGVQVSGLVGYATISFTVPNYQYGWSGIVYQYLDGKWVALPTSVTPKSESQDATASATIYSDGIYALILTYHPPANSSKSSKQKACQFEAMSVLMAEMVDDNVLNIVGLLMGGTFDISKLSNGQKLKYKVVDIDPPGSVGGNISGSVTVQIISSGSDGNVIGLAFDDGSYITLEDDTTFLAFRFYLPGCYYDYSPLAG